MGNALCTPLNAILFDMHCLRCLQSSIERETGQLTRQVDALRREHDKLVQERGRLFKRLDKLQDDLRVGLTMANSGW